jgi:aromatic ring-opening dioxygenase LigB subunit
MNPFVFSCITPHGGEIIPELSGDKPERMAKTRQSMEQLGRKMTEAAPDCLIILTPHGTRIDGQFSLTGSEFVSGNFEENGQTYEMKRPVHRELAESIFKTVQHQNLPAGVLGYGTSSGPLSCLQLDWGAIVPLRFMPDVPVVIITPSRELPYNKHFEFGRALKKAAVNSSLRIGLIASCDWSHTHEPSGPYGYHEDAKDLDEQVVNLIGNGKLEQLADFPEEFVQNAKPDGIWQSLILAGAIAIEDRVSELLSYEAPTYFGMICSSFS